MTTIDVPEDLRAKARALGAEGERWLGGLDGMLGSIAADWSLTLGPPLGRGGAGYLVEATTADGRAAVLKLALPDGLDGNTPFADELRALLIGAGNPAWVEVLAHDRGRRAVLMERLGAPLGDLGLPVEDQITVVASTVAQTWFPVAGAPPSWTGDRKAAWLARFITERWSRSGGACRRNTVDQALALCAARQRVFDASSTVFIHADAHPGNILESARSDGTFTLIDPEGLISEPAHDLAIALRGWNAELLAAGGDDLAAVFSRWCDLMVEAAGDERVDRRALWEWATIERVSTGLFLAHLGIEDEAREYLAVADILASS